MNTRIPYSWRSLALVLTVALGAVHSAPAQDQQRYAHEFHHDFRGKPLPKELQVVGQAPDEYLKEEREGFRVTLPKTWIHKSGGVGVRTTFKLTGDFEATGTFEILQAEVPLKGWGVGASIRVHQVEPEAQGATLARIVRGGGNQIVFWDRGPKPDKNYNHGLRKCTDNLLRLRLKRVGPTLHYLWAPGLEGENFEEFGAENEFGDREINAVRMSAITGQQPCNVDVRFIELRIGSGGLIPAGDAKVKPAPPPPNDANVAPQAEPVRSKTWLIAALVVGSLLSLLVVGGLVGVLLIRRRQPVVESKAPEHISFACPGCGKAMKAKAADAGKKLKCAKCGNVAIVPNAE